MHKNEDNQTVKLIHTMSSVLVGGVFGLGICLIILFLCSMGISSGWLNNRSMMQYTVAGCVIGGFGGALFSILRVRAKTLIIGLLASCIQFLLILTIGFLMYPGITLSQNGAGIAVGCLAGGVVAGFLGGKPKKKRRK